MAGIENLPLAIVGARMSGDLACAIQQPDRHIGSHQGERPAHGLRRDRVVVEIEADVDRLAGADAFDAIGIEAMRRQRDQTRLLVGEDLVDGAAVLSWPAPLVGDLVAPLPGLPVALGQGRETPAGPEGIAHVADGALYAPLLIPGPNLAGMGGEMIVGGQLD